MLCDYLHETGFLLKCDCDDCKKKATPDQRTFTGKDIGDIFLDILKSGWSIPKLDRFIGARDYISFINELGRVRGLFSGPLRNDTTAIELPLRCYAPGHKPQEETHESPAETDYVEEDEPRPHEVNPLDKWRRAALMNYEHLTKLLMMMYVGELSFSDKVEPYVQAHIRKMVADSLAKTSELILSDAEACSILGIQDRLMIIPPNFMNDAFDKNNK